MTEDQTCCHDWGRRTGDAPSPSAGHAGFVLALSVALIVVLVVLSSVFVVDTTEYAVVTRFGRPVQTVLDPGLRFKWPWPIDSVVRFDNRLMILEVPGPNRPAREYITLEEESGIGKNVEATTYTCWRIRQERRAVLRFLESLGDRTAAERLIADVVGSKLGEVLGEHDFAALVSIEPGKRRWTEIVDTVKRACREAVSSECGIEIVDVQIQRLAFPDQNRRNVFERMRAERQRIAARYRSEGDEKAANILAEAEKEREEILAAAYRDAERIRGRADAEAARIYAEAYGQAPEFYGFLRTLQSYEETIDEQTVLILSSDSAFLELLNAPVGRFRLPRLATPHDSDVISTTQPAAGQAAR